MGRRLGNHKKKEKKNTFVLKNMTEKSCKAIRTKERDLENAENTFCRSKKLSYPPLLSLPLKDIMANPQVPPWVAPAGNHSSCIHHLEQNICFDDYNYPAGRLRGN